MFLLFIAVDNLTITIRRALYYFVG